MTLRLRSVRKWLRSCDPLWNVRVVAAVPVEEGAHVTEPDLHTCTTDLTLKLNYTNAQILPPRRLAMCRQLPQGTLRSNVKLWSALNCKVLLKWIRDFSFGIKVFQHKFHLERWRIEAWVSLYVELYK